MAAREAIFAGMRSRRVLGQRPVAGNLRGIPGVRGDGECRDRTLLSASGIGLGRTLLAGWWGNLMLGRDGSHHRSLSWVGWVWTRRNWAVVHWSRPREVGARRGDGIGTRPSVHRRRLWAWEWGVVRRSHVHWVDW